MDKQHNVDTDRRAALVEAAAGVFIRFGFRKTSMDEVARAACLSRQGLYFHFSTKEELFREVVRHLAGAVLESLTTALARRDLGLEERLHAAFMAMHVCTFGGHDSAHVQELFGSAAELCPKIVHDLEESIIAALAREMSGAPRAALPARAMAEHIYATAYGFKLRGLSRQEYSTCMKKAVRIVCAAQTNKGTQ